MGDGGRDVRRDAEANVDAELGREIVRGTRRLGLPNFRYDKGIKMFRGNITKNGKRCLGVEGGT